MTLTTPVFMPVGTKATIKGMPLDMFKHRQDGLILTDSGGFQVFSLGLDSNKRHEGKDHQVKMKLKEE